MSDTELTNWVRIKRYVDLPPNQYAYGSVARAGGDAAWFKEFRKQAQSHDLRVDIEVAGKRGERVIFIRPAHV